MRQFGLPIVYKAQPFLGCFYVRKIGNDSSQNSQTLVNFASFFESLTLSSSVFEPFTSRQIDNIEFWRPHSLVVILVYGRSLNKCRENSMWSRRLPIHVGAGNRSIFLTLFEHLDKVVKILDLHGSFILEVDSTLYILPDVEFHRLRGVQKVEDLFVVNLCVGTVDLKRNFFDVISELTIVQRWTGFHVGTYTSRPSTSLLIRSHVPLFFFH